MPELPDIVVYVEHLERRLAGATFTGARVRSPNLLRTAVPPLETAQGREVQHVRRMGKRIVFELGGDFALVLHLMIAGRLRWKETGAKLPGKIGLAALDFSTGTLLVTEAGTHQRASLHLVEGAEALRALDPGGLEVLEADLAAFRAALLREDHTLKRALTDPRLFSGIGNAYSDEILHRARLSPLQRAPRLADEEIARLFEAVRTTLTGWTERLRRESGDAFPEKVTASREGMAVHGRWRRPCPDCGAPVQRIVYAENETHYCARCQTGGRLLADRALSRLLKADWPRTLEELEEGRGASLVPTRGSATPVAARASRSVAQGRVLLQVGRQPLLQIFGVHHREHLHRGVQLREERLGDRRQVGWALEVEDHDGGAATVLGVEVGGLGTKTVRRLSEDALDRAVLDVRGAGPDGHRDLHECAHGIRAPLEGGRVRHSPSR